MTPVAEEWHKKAMHAIFAEDWEKALFSVNKGLSVYRENSKLLILKAVIDRKLGNFEVALNDLERASRHMNFENLVEDVNT
jgi:tetratricopeptide (TPR) repeat protein